MKSTQEMIAVMQAYVEGKKIEYFDTNGFSIGILDYPSWDWVHYDYRVKEEQFTPKFNIGDLVVSKKYQSQTVILRYEGNKPVVDYEICEIAVSEDELDFYKEPTSEEITAQWVKDNDVKEGDRVFVRGRGIFNVDSILGNKILIDLGGVKIFLMLKN